MTIWHDGEATTTAEHMHDLQWFESEHQFLVEQVHSLKKSNTDLRSLNANLDHDNRLLHNKVADMRAKLKGFYENRNEAFEKFETKLTQAMNDRDQYKEKCERQTQMIRFANKQIKEYERLLHEVIGDNRP